MMRLISNTILGSASKFVGERNQIRFDGCFLIILSA